MPHKTYPTIKNLIHWKAWSYHRRFPCIPFDELVSEGSLCFCEAWGRYNPHKGATFSSFFVSYLSHTLSTFCQRWARFDEGEGCEELVGQGGHHTSPHHYVQFQQFLFSLPSDLKEVATLLLNSPQEFLSDTSYPYTPKAVRGALYRHLRKERKWSWPRIWRTMKGLKEAVEAL